MHSPDRFNPRSLHRRDLLKYAGATGVTLWASQIPILLGRAEASGPSIVRDEVPHEAVDGISFATLLEAAQHEVLPQYAVMPVPQEGQRLTLNCEAATMSILARYLRGFREIFSSSPQNYFTSTNVVPLHENPNRGYRGNINGIQSIRPDSATSRSRYGYGTHAAPLHKALAELGIPGIYGTASGIEGQSNLSPEEMYRIISTAVKKGLPPIVWMSYTRGARTASYTDGDGVPYTIWEGEHVLVVDGVDDTSSPRYRVVDCWNNLNPNGRRYWLNGGIPGWDLSNFMVYIPTVRRTDISLS